MLLNAGAGTASHRGADGLLGDLEAALQALDVSADLEICSGPDLKRLAEAALARARSAEIDAVVVGGGDGSVGSCRPPARRYAPRHAARLGPAQLGYR